MHTRPVRLLVGVLFALVTLFCIGCSPHTAWRVPDTTDLTCRSPSSDVGGLIEQVESTYVQLAYIEFTERGNLFNRGCVNKVFKLIQEEIAAQAPEDSLAVIVYVHGWKHNASPKDDDVKRFKDVLRMVYRGSAAPAE